MRPRRRARETRRERPSVLAALMLACVWTAGFEVAPLAHALEHARETRHGSAHCHDGTCHDDGAPPEADLASSEHGAGTLAHRDVVALAPAEAVLRWPALVLGPALAEPALDAPCSTRDASAPVARGPPLA